MYYIEEIYNPALRTVRITIYGEGITKSLWHRDYEKAVPGNPYLKDCVDGRMICVDACETWEEANAKAGESAQKHNTAYSLGGDLAKLKNQKSRRIFPDAKKGIFKKWKK